MVTRASRLAVLLPALLSCSDPYITEDTSTGCRNRYDDDGDGLVDCADPSCIASGVCEAGESACRNGRDDDGDGSIDCQQNTCIAGGYCDSAEAACAPTPQSGCLVGQGCYLSYVGMTSQAQTRCRLASAVVGTLCSNAAIAALDARDRHPCVAGRGCIAFGADDGVCSPYCRRNDDCPAGGMCEPDPALSMRPGLCTVPCNPLNGAGCLSDRLRCASWAESRRLAFNEGGARHHCVAATVPRGAAAVGAPCNDPPTLSTPSSRICAAGSVCIQRADGTRCRALCDLAAPSCPAGIPCQVLYPTGRPVAYGEARFGACTQ